MRRRWKLQQRERSESEFRQTNVSLFENLCDQADFVVSLIRFLLKEHDSDPKNIGALVKTFSLAAFLCLGVITLYKSQLRQIQMKLETSG